jgi:hypothetical protein
MVKGRSTDLEGAGSIPAACRIFCVPRLLSMRQTNRVALPASGRDEYRSCGLWFAFLLITRLAGGLSPI